MRLSLTLAALSIFGFPQNGFAQESESVCAEVGNASENIHLMVCDRSPDDAVLAKIGRETCDGRLACGVWFWRNAQDAPAQAPRNHDGLTDAQIQSALGVYAAEEDTLIRISKE